MIEYRLSKKLEVNLRILAKQFAELSKDYEGKEAKLPLSPINTEIDNEHRSGNFQGKSEAYHYAARELDGLLNWYGVEQE